MHKVYCKGIRSLEDKFDKEKADWVEENIGTIRFDKIPFEEAARYNKKQIVIMTVEEYAALSDGKDYVMPETVRQSLLSAIKAMEAVLIDEEVSEE